MDYLPNYLPIISVDCMLAHLRASLFRSIGHPLLHSSASSSHQLLSPLVICITTAPRERLQVFEDHSKASLAVKACLVMLEEAEGGFS